MATMVKHKVNGNKEVIFNGVRYSPDKDGFVLLPGTLETIDVIPVDDENTPDSGKAENTGTVTTTDNSKLETSGTGTTPDSGKAENTPQNGKKKSGGK
ncbi:MAG TPA: hypothetical protein DDY71_05295 [Spirochaetia bacterium]|nr:hypothetical protein [Spirochaetia bacterium]